MTFWKKKKKISSNILGTSENKNKEQMNLWETVANIQLRGLEQGSPDGCFRGSSDKTQNSSTTTEQEMWRQQQLLTLSTGLLNVKFSPVFPSQILTMIVFIINQSSCREGKKPFPCAATTADGETHPYLVTQQQQQGFWSPWEWCAQHVFTRGIPNNRPWACGGLCACSWQAVLDRFQSEDSHSGTFEC